MRNTCQEWQTKFAQIPAQEDHTLSIHSEK